MWIKPRFCGMVPNHHISRRFFVFRNFTFVILYMIFLYFLQYRTIWGKISKRHPLWQYTPDSLPNINGCSYEGSVPKLFKQLIKSWVIVIFVFVFANMGACGRKIYIHLLWKYKPYTFPKNMYTTIVSTKAVIKELWNLKFLNLCGNFVGFF